MNVFVLCTGRCGSLTFIQACKHISNFTASHESRWGEVGLNRLAYPANHIEADNRLSWMLGRLDEQYGDAAYYVHLIRNRYATALSFKRRRPKASIAYAYARYILTRSQVGLDECLDYYDTVNANIRHFLRDKPRTLSVTLDDPKPGFEKFWQDIAAEGDLDAALREWESKQNASKPSWQERLSGLLRPGAGAGDP